LNYRTFFGGAKIHLLKDIYNGLRIVNGK